MNFNSNNSEPSGGAADISSMQQQLNQMQQLFHQMAQTLGQVTGPQQGAGVNYPPPTNVPGAYMQQPPPPGPHNIQQMMAMAQHNPQMQNLLAQMPKAPRHSMPLGHLGVDTNRPPPNVPAGPPGSMQPNTHLGPMMAGGLPPQNVMPPLNVPPPGMQPSAIAQPAGAVLPASNKFSAGQGNTTRPNSQGGQRGGHSMPHSRPYGRDQSRDRDNRLDSRDNCDRNYDQDRSYNRYGQRSYSDDRRHGRDDSRDRGRDRDSFRRGRRDHSSESSRSPQRSFSGTRTSERYQGGSQRGPSSRNFSDRGGSRGADSDSSRSRWEGDGDQPSRYDNHSDRRGWHDADSRNKSQTRFDGSGDKRAEWGRHGGGQQNYHRGGPNNQPDRPTNRQSSSRGPSGPRSREIPKRYQITQSPERSELSDDMSKKSNNFQQQKPNNSSKSPAKKRSRQQMRPGGISSDSSSSDDMSDFDETRCPSSAKEPKKYKEITNDDLYGAYDEHPLPAVEASIIPDYEESTPAGKYLTKDSQSGNMVATKHLLEMEDKFEKEVLQRASNARKGRDVYKYPERTARLTCCRKDDCHSHESDDDGTDESDMEEGEIVDSDEEGQTTEVKEGSKLSMEVQAKIDHPERVHKLLCFNDKGETNYGPLCKCSRKARRLGVRHGFYAGEKLLEPCKPDSNNLDKLYHYRISLSSLTNFKSKEVTSICYDDRDYVFDGFSLFTHQKLDQLTSLRTILYHSYYTIKLVGSTFPAMFTVRTLDLVCDYLFTELLELVDTTWVQEAFKEGCRQLHIMPRFTRSLPDNGMEVLAMPHVLKYLLDNSHPLVESSNLSTVASMDKRVWEEKVVRNYRFTLATIPGMRPSTVRIDNMDRPEQKSDVISYPQILHYVYVSDSLSLMPTDDKQYMELVKRKRRVSKFISRKMTPLSSEDVIELQNVQYELEKYLEKKKEVDGMKVKRHRLIELNCQGYFATGVKSDIAMWGLIIPKVVDHVRFMQSLASLQADIGYRFKDPSLLQLALSHASYMSGFCLNQDHVKNTLTNCGYRHLEFGNFCVHKEVKVKKRGLKALLEIMSHKYRQYTGPVHSNERLEFLGDAVLEFLTTVHLFYLFPDLEEGGLSTYRTAIVKNVHLTVLAKKVGLQHYLLFSHGPDLCYSTHFDHALANAFEATIGAVFLDGGMDEADKFLAKYLSLSMNFPEFTPVWMDLPLHPLQDEYPEGDRCLIPASPPLQKCEKFEKATGLKFDHICLLARALTHPNMNYTDFSRGTNQTLEFLGDSVLQFIVTDYLYKCYPNHHEGHLTLLRSSLVNNLTQAQIFKDLGIAHYAFKKTTLSQSVMTKEKADYVEAILGAIYVDQGLDVCGAFCKALFFPRLKETIEKQNWNDAKSLLQQCCLELRGMNCSEDPQLPVYKVIGKSGPSHCLSYKVAVYYKDERIGVGLAGSVKKGQFAAAQNALDENQAMFPMLKPGTHKLQSSNRQHLLDFLRARRQKKYLRKANYLTSR